MKDKALWSQCAKQVKNFGWQKRQTSVLTSDRDIKELCLCGTVFTIYSRGIITLVVKETTLTIGRFQILEFPFQEGTWKNLPCSSKRRMGYGSRIPCAGEQGQMALTTNSSQWHPGGKGHSHKRNVSVLYFIS